MEREYIFWHSGRAFLLGTAGLVIASAAATVFLIVSESPIIGAFGALHVVVLPVPLSFALDRHLRCLRRQGRK